MNQENELSITERTEQISRLVREFEHEFKEKTSNPDSFATLHEIEQMWGKLRANTDKIYSDMLQELLAHTDETELIRKKNRIPTQRDNSSCSTEGKERGLYPPWQTLLFPVCPPSGQTAGQIPPS